VPKEQIIFLRDKEATLKNINTAFNKLLKQTKEGDSLITYFTGHGTTDQQGLGYFINYDAPDVEDWSGLWEVADIYKAIEQHFKGKTVLLTADCCFSGTLSAQP
jgi:uncharacterized caspase-like protein